MALPRTDSLRLSFLYWPIRNGEPRASPRPSHEQPAFPVHLRSDRSSLLSPRLWLELSRSLSPYPRCLKCATPQHIASIRSDKCTPVSYNSFAFTRLHALMTLNRYSLR